MLVLSRKANQKIIIGDNIILVVVSIIGDRVQLGLCAPRNVPIDREEVRRRMRSGDNTKDTKQCVEEPNGMRQELHERYAEGPHS